MSKQKNFTETIVLMGLLIALEVILSRFLSIQLPMSRISFGFLPLALSGMLFGPLIGSICGIGGDLIGFFLWPSGSYFIGFTISAGIKGLIYGYMLKNKGFNTKNVVISALIIAIFITLLLDTLWLNILLGKSVIALLPARLITALYMLIAQILVIRSVGEILKKSKLV